MPILLLFFGLILPRITAVLLLIFTDWFSSFSNIVIPILGIIFLPYSVLWYSIVLNWFGGVWGIWQLVFMVIAVLLDISSFSHPHHKE